MQTRPFNVDLLYCCFLVFLASGEGVFCAVRHPARPGAVPKDSSNLCTGEIYNFCGRKLYIEK